MVLHLISRGQAQSIDSKTGIEEDATATGIKQSGSLGSVRTGRGWARTQHLVVLELKRNPLGDRLARHVHIAIDAEELSIQC